MKTSTRIASYIAIFGLVFSSGVLVGNSMPSQTIVIDRNSSSSVFGVKSDVPNLSKEIDLSPLWAVKEILQNRYIHTDKLDGDALSYGIVKGFVESLDDPYTEYMDPEETKEFNEALNSELEGIGAEMTTRDGLLTVVSTVKGSPAEAAGLLADDLIISVDDTMTADLNLLEAIMLIRGEEGTKVGLTVVREGVDDPFDLEIERGKITVESVMSEEIENGIWHVSVNQFSDDTKVEFNRALLDIKTQDPKGIVLDLRFNGGGYLDGAVDILSGFLRGQKEVVTIEYRDSSKNEKLKTDGAPIFPELPLVVLINRGSASASEIVAGAIQDLQRGVLMGETSYGKGTVQEVDPLKDGSSLRFTVARWLPPSGDDINENGIKPDIEVEITEDDIVNENDRQLNEAFNYLNNL